MRSLLYSTNSSRTRHYYISSLLLFFSIEVENTAATTERVLKMYVYARTRPRRQIRHRASRRIIPARAVYSASLSLSLSLLPHNNAIKSESARALCICVDPFHSSLSLATVAAAAFFLLLRTDPRTPAVNDRWLALSVYTREREEGSF